MAPAADLLTTKDAVPCSDVVDFSDAVAASVVVVGVVGNFLTKMVLLHLAVMIGRTGEATNPGRSGYGRHRPPLPPQTPLTSVMKRRN